MDLTRLDAGNAPMYGGFMDAAIQVPTGLVEPSDLTGARSRQETESFALEAFRAGRMTASELRRILGLGRLQLDAFLKSRGIYEDVTLEDIERDMADLKACLLA